MVLDSLCAARSVVPCRHRTRSLVHPLVHATALYHSRRLTCARRMCWCCGCVCFSSLVSVARGQPGDARDVDPEDELIDISMDSPDGSADSRWYKCTSVAAFNTTLEFDATTPIGGKVNPGVVIEALEHADTRAGKRRIRTHKGWFSLVSTNGTRCEHAPARLRAHSAKV